MKDNETKTCEKFAWKQGSREWAIELLCKIAEASYARGDYKTALDAIHAIWHLPS